jgi:sugar phosphate isomerase/epimerase
MSKIGVIHYNFPDFSLAQFLQFCVDTGYGYTELNIADVWDEEDPEAQPEQEAEALRGKMEDMGLKTCAVSARNDFLVVGRDALDEQIERMERVCRLAKLLGTDTLRTEGGWAKEEIDEGDWAPLIIKGLQRCAELGEAYDVRFALDNHGHVTNDGDLEVKIFEAVDSPRVGANLDTMNYRWAGHDLDAIRRFYDIIAPYTFHTHMKDGRGSGENYQGAALGEGEIDLEYAVRTLKEAGYDGVWTAEYEGPEAEGGVGYAKCCRWLQENV